MCIVADTDFCSSVFERGTPKNKGFVDLVNYFLHETISVVLAWAAHVLKLESTSVKLK